MLRATRQKKKSNGIKRSLNTPRWRLATDVGGGEEGLCGREKRLSLGGSNYLVRRASAAKGWSGV